VIKIEPDAANENRAEQEKKPSRLEHRVSCLGPG
jgi:hypothetical protein